MPIASRVSGEVQVKLTPITGRVSRAKKGAPIYTCEICKPPKTFTRQEHLRRHQLSHQTPQYPCTYPGCGRAFHRADLLARHTTRHEFEGDKASSRGSTGDNSRRASTTSTGYDEGPQGPMQPSPVIRPRHLHSSSYSIYGNYGYNSPSQHHISPQQRRDSNRPGHYTHSADIPTINQQPPSLDHSPGSNYDCYDHDIPRTSPANALLLVTSGVGPEATQAMINPDLAPRSPSDREFMMFFSSPPPMTLEWQDSFVYTPPIQAIHSSETSTTQPTFFHDPLYPGMIDPSMSLYHEDNQNFSARDVEATRKRHFQKDDGHDDQGRDGGQSGKRARVDDSKKAASRKLACPYSKKHPNYDQLARSCSGPGWDTVHRMKEHLDRNHALPPSCDRCFTAFKTDVDRSAHLRSEIQCQVRERPSRMQGFDASQRGQLKGRPKGYKQMSEIHKWCHIYAILFPETEKANIPSPFYNYGTFQDPGHPVDLIVEYDQFLRREMPERVKDKLERRIKDTLNPVEETLRGQIVEIIYEVQHELSQLFKNAISTTMQNSYADPKAINIEKTGPEPQVDKDEGKYNREPTSREADGIQNCLGPEQSRLDNVPQVYPPEPFLDTFIRDDDFQLFDFSSLIDGEGTSSRTGFMPRY